MYLCGVFFTLNIVLIMSKNTIKALLHNNNYAKLNGNFIARVKTERSLNMKDICRAAIKREDVDIPAADYEYLVNLWLEEMAIQLCNGNSVNAGWFVAFPKIKGVFSSIEEEFDPEKHSVMFDILQGIELRRHADNVEVEILGMGDVSAKITTVTDIETGNIDSTITPEKNMYIKGTKLKIVGDNPDTGVYFINQENMERTKAQEIIHNKPSELIVTIPRLSAGNYKMQFSSQYTGSVVLKYPRTVEFEKMLTVL